VKLKCSGIKVFYSIVLHFEQNSHVNAISSQSWWQKMPHKAQRTHTNTNMRPK